MLDNSGGFLPGSSCNGLIWRAGLVLGEVSRGTRAHRRLDHLPALGGRREPRRRHPAQRRRLVGAVT